MRFSGVFTIYSNCFCSVNRAHSGSSLSSQEEPRQNANSLANKNGDAGVIAAQITPEMLEKWKVDLLNEVGELINRAKEEILGAIRQEKR